MLKSFHGFRGVAIAAHLDGLEFVIIASNEAQLEVLYTSLLPDATPFDPSLCKKSVMIQAALLPEPKTL